MFQQILRVAAIAKNRVAIMFFVFLFFVPSRMNADDIGLVKNRPASGRYVETDRGFMVPYTQSIPGSKVTFEMEPIPGGVFKLGSPESEEGRNPDEGPVVSILIEPFWMARNEVTWSEYKTFMELSNVFEKFEEQGIRKVTKNNAVDAVTAPSKLYEPSFVFASGEDPKQPAIAMSQFAAKQYTKWLSLLTSAVFRLPTEAEWEYACRAGSQSAYSFGDDIQELDKHAWHYENADDKTQVVALKKPNAWGLYDMHGNVSEWVLDAYSSDWYQQLSKRGSPVPAGEAINWPTQLYPRVLRGGSWNLDPPDCRSAARRQSNDEDWRSYDPNVPKSPWWFASDESQDVGFRVVRPLNAVPKNQLAKYWDSDLDEITRAVNQRIFQEGRGERGLVNPQLPEAINTELTK